MAIAKASEEQHKYKDNNKNKNKFTEDELEVANVLLQLRSSISTKNKHIVYEFEYNWGTKKLRSALLNPPKIAVTVVKQQQATSPNTPLCFSPIQTHNNITPYKYTAPLHLRKKELKEAVEEKVQTQHQLKESILKVKEYLNTIMAENSALKAKKRQLVNGEKGGRKKMKATNPTMMTEGNSLQVALQQPPLINPNYHQIQDVNELNYQQPLIYPCQQFSGAVALWRNDPVYAGTSSQLHYQQQPLICHQAFHPMLQYHHHRSQQQKQVVQIDLNVLPSAEDEQMIKRVEAQEARKKRMRVNKEKRTRVTLTA